MIDLNLIVEPLTPIHIGTGEEIDPLSYDIIGPRADRFCRIDLERLMGGLSKEENEKLLNLIDRTNPIQVREWIQRRAKDHGAVLYEAKVTKRVAREYVVHQKDINNQLFVHTIVRDSLDSAPIIPGSSLKGAIRTAVVDSLAQGETLPEKTDLVEPQLLGYLEERQDRRPRKNLNADPFRCLKVPDVKFQPEDVVVHRMMNVKRVEQRGGPARLEERKFNLVAETIDRVGENGRPETALHLQFDDQLEAQPRSKIAKLLPKTFDQLRDICNRFYLQTLKDEERSYYRDTPIMDLVSRIRKEAEKPDRFLLRVGRFSGVYSVTLHGHRRPKARPIRGRPAWGGTCYVTEENEPLGWLAVRKVS